MRRAIVFLGLLISACVPQAEPATTAEPTTTAPAPVTTSTTRAPTTTSTAPPTTTTTTLPPLQALAYEEVANLDFPIQVVAEPGSSISYVITKDGRVWSLEGDVIAETPVLDINGRVRNSGEQGLLSLAIGGEYLYVHYSANDGDTVVSRFRFLSPKSVDPDSEKVLLRVNQPASNHNGGMIQLEDGVLYVALGDGGGANDKYGNGQNTSTLLGGLVAIDVDGDQAPTLFAYGLRNPWRFWIDGTLIYIADVGQNSYEEVSVTGLSEGTNYGWPIMEGLHCFRPSSGCDQAGLALPLVEVAHGDAGTCSITGGLVYRGTRIPELVGSYLYSDYCGGYLRSFRYEDGDAIDQKDWTSDVGGAGRVTGFGYDGSGEIYVATTGRLLRLVPVR